MVSESPHVVDARISELRRGHVSFRVAAAMHSAPAVATH